MRVSWGVDGAETGIEVRREDEVGEGREGGKDGGRKQERDEGTRDE